MDAGAQCYRRPRRPTLSRDRPHSHRHIQSNRRRRVCDRGGNAHSFGRSVGAGVLAGWCGEGHLLLPLHWGSAACPLASPCVRARAARCTRPAAPNTIPRSHPEPAPPAPAPSQPAPGGFCDMQNNCWSAAPSTTGSVGSVPLEVTDNQAFVTMRIGRLSFRALLDSGATSLSLPETGADALVCVRRSDQERAVNVRNSCGWATPPLSHHHHQSKCGIGSHVVSDVRSTVEPDSSIPLVGMAVLRAISGRFSIDLANSEFRFE